MPDYSQILQAAPRIEEDPDIIRQGSDVTILAPLVQVSIDLNPKEKN